MKFFIFLTLIFCSFNLSSNAVPVPGFGTMIGVTAGTMIGADFLGKQVMKLKQKHADEKARKQIEERRAQMNAENRPLDEGQIPNQGIVEGVGRNQASGFNSQNGQTPGLNQPLPLNPNQPSAFNSQNWQTPSFNQPLTVNPQFSNQPSAFNSQNWQTPSLNQPLAINPQFPNQPSAFNSQNGQTSGFNQPLTFNPQFSNPPPGNAIF